jgi:hypothetical protein
MIRLHTVVEGQTEEEFVNSVLAVHLGAFDISTDARCVETGRHRARIYRGGLRSYAHVKKDLTLWMKEDRRPDAFFTTMLDLYALPKDFPAFDDARRHSDPYHRVSHLEQAFADDLGHPRFVPYLQLFEFEALILTDPARFAERFAEHVDEIQALVALCAQFDSPELINDGEETAPSKRIVKVIPAYEGAKVSAGPIIADKIGLPMIRGKCRHFNAWLTKLENLVLSSLQ